MSITSLLPSDPNGTNSNGNGANGNGSRHNGSSHNGNGYNGNGSHGNGHNGSEPPAGTGNSSWVRAFWERLDRPDSAALHGLLSGAAWFLAVVVFGFIMSNELTTPDIFSGIPQLVWSRLRPSHINMGLFGLFSTGMFGGWYFIVPRLCKTPLRSNRAANLMLFFWNLAVFLGIGAILNGDTQGKEYTELPWWIDWPVLVLMCVNAVIIFQTIAARREPKMYVSLWYIGGSVVWVTMMYFIGNVMWHPFSFNGKDKLFIQIQTMSLSCISRTVS